ncbi:MAG: DUF87 domain-containing protein [Pseudobutyrivibrio ruminis]|uniref:DUF87 domain-containing protein n=1 Tax=Pseudobutyrivibrio ruminis TaxID=46206 RepID=A0A927YN39_9FIRM|nr:DUF87 domain-containing protein [Pseudobutyrivibrio ruminis]
MRRIQRNRKTKDEKRILVGASQELIDVKNVIDGIIETYTGRYYGVVEILPINFYKKSPSEQLDTMAEYLRIFTTGDFKVYKLKVMSDMAEPTELINNLRWKNKDEKNISLKTELDDYIDFIQKQSKTNAVTKRYFFIWRYTGSNGKMASSMDEIIDEMVMQRQFVESVFSSCGNPTVKPDANDENGNVTDYNRLTLSYLYKFYNRKTSKTESMDERAARVKRDFDVFNKNAKGLSEPKKLTFPDILAPKGVSFTSRHTMFMDGTCYGFVGVIGKSWNRVNALNWFDRCTEFGAIVDVDLIGRVASGLAVNASLAGFNKVSKAILDESKRESAIISGLGSKREDTVYYSQAMKDGAEIHQCGIVFTIRTNTPKENKKLVKKFKDQLVKHLELLPTDTTCKVQDYFSLADPLINFNSAFSTISKDLITEDLASTYCYTAYEINDPKGFVLGKLVGKNTLVILDNFISAKFSNSNIVVLGQPGAGKSFTMMMIGRRLYFNGVRITYIIPKKGYEYKPLCKAMNGNYIAIYPGSEVCINVFDIQPEDEIDIEALGDEITIDTEASLLANKIKDIVAWIKMTAVSEPDKQKDIWFSRENLELLNDLIYEVYSEKGITDDNDSIYLDKEKKVLKEMPIIGDLYEKTKLYAQLKGITMLLNTFVNGTCKNLNGQTNIKYKSNFTVYDVNEDKMDKSLFPSFMFLCTLFTYGRVKGNKYVKDMIFLDEVWKIMADKQAAETVEDMVRICRSYGAGTCVGTQMLGDLKKAGKSGEAVLGCSDLTILLKMKPEQIDLVENTFRLSEADKKTIDRFPANGRGLLITNNDRLKIDLVATDWEKKLFNTSIDKRKGVA